MNGAGPRLCSQNANLHAPGQRQHDHQFSKATESDLNSPKSRATRKSSGFCKIGQTSAPRPPFKILDDAGIPKTRANRSIDRLAFTVDLGRLDVLCGKKTMVTISGTRKPGGHAASGNLVQQIPWIVKEFPEVANVQRATLNLQLEKMLLVAIPDFRTKPISWDDKAPEVFDFLRINLEAPEGASLIPAWLYIAHRSEHRKTPDIHEVIAPPIANLNAYAKCRIHISRSSIELPYSEKAVIIIL